MGQMKFVVDGYRIRATISPFFDSRMETRLDSCGQIFRRRVSSPSGFSFVMPGVGEAARTPVEKIRAPTQEMPGLCRASWEVGDVPTRLSPSTKAIAHRTALYGIESMKEKATLADEKRLLTLVRH